MDFQCLFLTARLLHRPFFVARAALSSALGAIYACAALFMTVPGTLALVLDLAVCLVMCVIVCGGRGRGLSRLLVPFGLYFGVSFAVGGVMSGMAALLSRLELPLQKDEGAISSLGFFLLAAVGGLCTFLWGRLCQRRAKGARAELTLTLAARHLTVRGLVDTGNLLTDPVSGRPVVILDKKLAAGWLPPPLRDLGEADLSRLPHELARRVRLIPARSVTGASMLVAILPDAAALDAGRGPLPVELAVVALQMGDLPADCGALLPAAILTQ
jgi:stage II sporulation protein GA (sporulation sigma-E factor processing peptidase)